MSITTSLYEEHLSGSEPDVDATTSDMHQLDLTDEPNSGPAGLIHATSLYEESLSNSEPRADTVTSDMHQLAVLDEPRNRYGTSGLTPATSLYEESLSDSEPGDIAATTSDAHQLGLIDEPIVGADPELMLSYVLKHAPYEELPPKLFVHNYLAYHPPEFVYGVSFRDHTALREVGLKYEQDYLDGSPMDYMALLHAYLSRSEECQVDASRINFSQTHEKQIVLYVASSWSRRNLSELDSLMEDAAQIQQSFEQHGWTTQFKWHLLHNYDKEFKDFNLPSISNFEKRLSPIS